MSILLRRPLPRRRALRGLVGGVAISVGLPFLDCFLNDNGTALASGAPLPVRFGTWFWGLGHTPGRAIDDATGPNYAFREECRVLDRHKARLNYFSAFNTQLDGRPGLVHFTGWVAARTGTVPPRTNQIAAPTLDVLVADHIGSSTRFRSLELSATGNPKDSYSYRSSGSHNAAEISPAAFYTRVFGPEFVDPNQAQFVPDPVTLARKSVLSGVSEESKALLQRIGAADRARIDEYFSSIRQLENQLTLQLEKPPPLAACVRPPMPVEGPIGVEQETVTANHNMLTDILSLAVACNQTRVFNMLYSQAASEVRRKGASFTHHILTHEEPPDPALGYQVESAELNIRAMEAWAYFIDAFAKIPEGAGTLLDNTLIFAQSDTSVAKTHSMDGIPMMTAGSASGRLRTGLHISGKSDPTTRVGLTVMQAMGVPIEDWGTGSMRTARPVTELLA